MTDLETFINDFSDEYYYTIFLKDDIIGSTYLILDAIELPNEDVLLQCEPYEPEEENIKYEPFYEYIRLSDIRKLISKKI